MHKSFLHRPSTRLCLALSICLAANGTAQARDLKVGPNPDDAYHTIQAAVDAAQPGDVILLAPQQTPYRESVLFNDRSGEEGKPIVLDGQGATLDGCDPLAAADWTATAPDLYRSTTLPQRLRVVPAVVGRFFFVFNGIPNRMGGASKSKAPTLKKPEELAANEWTYVADEKAFYIRLAPGAALESVLAPVRGNGVAFLGNCEHIKIRHLTVQRVWNDGFNIHGRTRDVSFENIRAFDCGDDGISEHEDCHITVDGLISRHNATGFCHINESQSEERNVVIEDCLSYGIYLLNDSQHTIQNCVVRSSSGFALRLSDKTTVKMDNVLFIADAAPQNGVRIETGAKLEATHIATWNLPWTIAGASVQLHDSALGAAKSLKIDATATWEADRNLLDFKEIRWHDKTFPETNFADYVLAAGQDAASEFEAVTEAALEKGSTAPYGINAAQLPSAKP